MTQDPPEHDASPAPARPDPPAEPAPPDPIESLEIAELTEVSDLIVLIEPPEVSGLIEIVEEPAPPRTPTSSELEALFDEPQPSPDELTALRMANRELVRINERLAATVEQRTAEMLAARDRQARFIADVNRQVRGPLDAIIGYSELLTEDLTSLELHDLAHDVEKIRGAGESLLELLGELIERRRLDGG